MEKLGLYGYKASRDEPKGRVLLVGDNFCRMVHYSENYRLKLDTRSKLKDVVKGRAFLAPEELTTWQT